MKAKREAGIKGFEERLERLERLEALGAFEEGIRIAKTLEKDLEKVESRIELLMNSAEAPKDESPELELFAFCESCKRTFGSQTTRTRQPTEGWQGSVK